MPQRRVLTMEQIIEAALELIDQDGLDAFSMRRLASRLGVAPMTLYGYVATKDELLEAIANHVLAALPLMEGERWDEGLATFFTAFHDVLLEHHSVAHLFTSRSIMSPAVLRHGEKTFAELLQAGFSERAAVEAITALFGYTLGAALYELARTRERADLTADRQRRLEELGPDEYPTIHALIPHLAAQTGPEQFRSGLRYLIQGMAMERKGRPLRERERNGHQGAGRL